MMMFDSRKKSVAVAYVIWFFFSATGAHRFYAGRTASGLAMLLLCIQDECQAGRGRYPVESRITIPVSER